MPIAVFFDFSCPYCYLAWSFLRKLGYPQISLDWVPWQILPEVPEEGVKRRWSNIPHLRALGEPAGATFADLSVVPNTRKAIASYLWAKSKGFGPKAQEVLFLSFFKEGLNISDPKVIGGQFAKAGLEDPSEAFEDQGVLLELDRNDKMAEEIGVEVVPSFVRDDTVLLSWDTSFTIQDLAEHTARWR
ncbi:putative dithiol-disulfide isomerase involved in polyketide biosynthesis [Thermanaerovibrio velox DSM 12556]|uniref:Putative dithiol-disulfide isomerase involved in polyketide biosynthesis n=1 Tax=Thermanaerovibrio velox DSM 12556 TaxID=926567 RepID=H0UMT6_9BACT|nr:DsbA family protein [Thermanaerovibrio velox]EHM09231.1 putative dithiol-disulfide isomerase involved in polyketide biosynthesis [Thermanaerovibrio velox DSM 12556]